MKQRLGRPRLRVRQIKVSDTIADGIEGERGLRIAGGWRWRQNLLRRNQPLVEVEQLQVEEQVRLSVFYFRCDSREDPGCGGRITRAAEGVVGPSRAVNQRVIRHRCRRGKIAGMGEVFGRSGEVALEVEREAGVIVRVEQARIELDGAVEIALGFSEPAQAKQAVAALQPQGSRRWG